MAETVKKDAVIFQSLAEPLLDGQIDLDTEWPTTNDILLYVTTTATLMLSALLIWAILKLAQMKRVRRPREQSDEVESIVSSSKIPKVELRKRHRKINMAAEGRKSCWTDAVVPADVHVSPPTVERQTSKCMKLSWSLTGRSHGKEIQGCYVEKKRMGSTFGWVRVTDKLKTNSYAISGLETGEWYKFRLVVVRHGTEFIGQETDEVHAAEVPGIPGDLKVFDITYHSCRLQWSAPDFDGGSPISRYKIYMKTRWGSWRKFRKVSCDKHTIKVNDLQDGETYIYGIKAVNKLGAGEMRQSDPKKAVGIDIRDQTSLATLELHVLEKEGMSNIAETFQLGLTTVVDLLEYLQPIMTSLAYRDVQRVSKSLQFYAGRLFCHMKNTSEKVESMNTEINKRLEAVVNEEGQKERLQRKNEKKSESILGHLRSLKSELENLQKECKSAKNDYERAMRDLRKARDKLEEKKYTQDTVATVGKVGLFVPIVGWAVAAVALPVAYTVLEDQVKQADDFVDIQSRNRDYQQKRVDSQKDDIEQNDNKYADLKDQNEKLHKEIDALKALRSSLKLKMDQQIEVSVKMKECVTFVGGATDRVEVLHDQVKLLYDLSAIISPLQELATHLSLPIGNRLGLLSDGRHMVTAAKRLETFSKSSEYLMSLDIPEHQKDLRIVAVVSCGENEIVAMDQIDKISKSISSNAVEDQKIILAQYSDCAEFLGTAPATIALMGQLITISLKQDFSLNEHLPRSGYRHIKWPESFRASMVQIANSGWKAFSTAQRNMDQIRMYSISIPTHLRNALQMLESAYNEEIRESLHKPLQLIKDSADRCLNLSKNAQSEFIATIHLVSELQEACVAKRSTNEKQRRELEAGLEEAKQEEKRLEEERNFYDEERRRQYKSIKKAEDKMAKAIAEAPSTGKAIAVTVVDTVLTGVKNSLDFISKPFKPQSDDEVVQIEHTSYNTAAEASSKTNAPCIDRKTAERIFRSIKPLSDVAKLYQECIDHGAVNPRIKIEICKKQSVIIRKKLTRIEEKLRNLDQSHAVIKQTEDICKECNLFCLKLEKSLNDISGAKAETSTFVNDIGRLCEAINDCQTEADKILKIASQSNKHLPKSRSGKSAMSYEYEKAKLKVESSYQQLKKAGEEYDRMSEKAKEAREELANVLKEIAETDMDKVDLETVGLLLCKCLKQLGNLKQEWGKLTLFFETINNIIEISLNDNLKNFLEVSKSSKSRNPEDRMLSAMKRELLYQQVFKALEIANFVQHVTESYTEASKTFFLPVVETLPKLIELGPDSSTAKMNTKLQQLQSNCTKAQSKINEYLGKKHNEFSAAVRARLSRLESLKRKELPKVQDSLKDLDADDFV